MCRVVEEAEGTEVWALQLIAKVMQRFERHANARHRISEEYYGVDCDPMGGLYQGLSLSGTSNREKLCFMLKNWQMKGMGATT